MLHLERFNRWIALIGLSMLASIGFLDMTIVFTALPAIQKAMNVSVLELQWVMNIFTMMIATLMIVMGHLGDTYGKRKVFYIGIFIFGVAAFGAGFSDSFSWLVFFRGLQGFGTSIIFTVAAALAPVAFPEKEKPIAIGIYSAVTGVGLAIGPFVGGVLVSLLSWRWVFYVNIPLILIGFLLCLGRLQETPKLKDQTIDWFGFIFLILGLGSLVYSIIHGESAGWSNIITVVGFVIAAVAMLALFVIEKRVAHPLLDLSACTQPRIILGLTMCLVVSVIPAPLLLFSPLYLSVARNYSPFTLGLFMLAMPVMQVVVSASWSPLVRFFKLGKMIIIGFVTCLASLLIQSFFTVSTSGFIIIFAYLLVGIIWCVANTGTLTLAYEAMPPEKAASAVGTMFTAWNVGTTILIAVMSVIFSNVEIGHMQQLLQTHSMILNSTQSDMVQHLLANPSSAKLFLSQLGVLSNHIEPLFKDAFMAGFHSVMWVSVGIVLLGLIAVSVLIKKINNLPQA